MSIQDVSAEQLAELFHHYHEALAPDFNCSDSREESWEEVPANERRRLVAAVRLALLELHSNGTEQGNDNQQYFPKPGEAEWGS